jgi:hypothetical protein
MKPLNLDNSPCSPISSNCVIWQGPDLACIKLCKGDTVSDVIAALATELCTILDQLNVSNYDLSCFDSTACPPVDFKALIQFLINHICALEGVTPTSTGTGGCPDCVVTVASCFIEGTTTTMQLVDYVNMIANRVCSILISITDLQDQINELDIRISVLENTPSPSFTLPTIVVDCTLQASPFIGFGGPATAISTVLTALINDNTYGYCALRTATGLPAALQAAVASQCITSGTDSLVYGTPMGTAYSGTWIGSPATVADAITDLWIALCDVFTYVSTSALSVQDTSTIDLSYLAGNVLKAKITDTGWVDLDGFGYYGVGINKPQCRRMGNQVHFRGSVYIPLDNPSSPGNVVPLTSLQAYNGIQGCTVWSGTGGCSIISNGGLLFNNGASVVPASITTGNFDEQYRSGFMPVARQLTVKGLYGTAITSVINIYITATKQLEVQTIADVEDGNAPTTLYGNSAWRLITSNIRAGEYLPNYIAAGSDIHNAPSNANFPLVSDTFAQTWDFTCDTAIAAQIGGFEFSLDGMITYLSPCNTETVISAVCP